MGVDPGTDTAWPLSKRDAPGVQAAHHQPAWASEGVSWLQALPFLQDGNKLHEPAALHLGSLPEGLELITCVCQLFVQGVQEPGDRG